MITRLRSISISDDKIKTNGKEQLRDSSSCLHISDKIEQIDIVKGTKDTGRSNTSGNRCLWRRSYFGMMSIRYM